MAPAAGWTVPFCKESYMGLFQRAASIDSYQLSRLKGLGSRRRGGNAGIPEICEDQSCVVVCAPHSFPDFHS